MEERMISIGLFNADDESSTAFKSFFAPTVPDVGDIFWIDDKRDMMNTSLTEYKVVKKSWILMLLPGAGGYEKRSLHCELFLSKSQKL